MKHLSFTALFVGAIAAMAWFELPWWWLLMALLLWLTGVGIGSGFIWSQYHLKAHLKDPSVSGKKIALTFDDGPSEFTAQVLDLLQQHNARATFFCIGKQVEKYPDLALRMVSEGHVIGNHSFSHSKTFDFYGKHQLISELEQTDQEIEAVTGEKVRFFRPPYGVTTPSLARALKQTGHEVIGWSIRSNDGISNDVGKILKRVESRLEPGAIVLLHDTSASSVAALEQLLLTLDRQNYQAVTVADLLDLEAYA